MNTITTAKLHSMFPSPSRSSVLIVKKGSNSSPPLSNASTASTCSTCSSQPPPLSERKVHRFSLLKRGQSTASGSIGVITAQLRRSTSIINSPPSVNSNSLRSKISSIKFFFQTTQSSVRSRICRYDRLHAETIAALLANNNNKESVSLTREGTGGVYVIKTGNATPLAVFKPRDEEFMAMNNPRGYAKENSIIGVTPHPVQRGFKIGTGALRERAAYLIDASYNHFSGVPETSVVSLKLSGKVKTGSLQRFVPSVSSAEDMGTSYFPVLQVQRIGILDVRMFNTDRHAGNILLSSRKAENGMMHDLTPIDHGYILPSFEHLESATFDWMRWPQAAFPFSPEALDHISAIDVSADAEICRKSGIEEDCVTTMRLCTLVLKTGASLGVSLQAIARALTRKGDGSSPSFFEMTVFQARRLLPSPSSFKSKVQYADALLEKVEPLIVGMLKRQPLKKPRSVSAVIAY